ncbi:flavin-dependent oxidoreductase [Rhodobacter sp. 24-YEA-8]|uniref:flavin-dependent oxidoreductase n=1 Tax=Rhodobacter sp. 24-YEA-8 TaxID=1884310 RepID=UPI000899EFF3|nr:flavin-dependent oxidoreductase [Rhodobacter sp. 24-YEA-8]SED82562.1 2-polyprenyl-6-methoxyphenol hydroxylase [Rhodobacter sp. 24-YEA-8]
MNVLVSGAGIGGLTLALMLQARGISCQIFEAAPEMRELGVGINVLPHAIRELTELGLLPELDRIAIRTSELRYQTRQGQEVWREPRGVEAGGDYPQFSIHRGRLHNMLREAVLDRLGPAAVQLSRRSTGFHQDADGVRLEFDTGQSAQGDLLVAADGVHSPIRAQLYPNEPGLKWNGVMMWRGAVETDAFADGRTMIVAGGFTYKLVLYPIAPGSAPGKVLMNWVVTYRPGAEGSPTPKREDWNRQGTLEELIPHVRAFDVNVIDLEALVRATPVFLEYPMCDRDPLPGWSHDRVTLIGDAAHPMYPVGSNGASQAILDTRALADLLAGATTPDAIRAALAAYDAARRPVTAEIVRLNRLGGPEGLIDEVERRAPAGFSDLDQVITPEERAAIVRGYASTAGFSDDQTRKRQ